MLGAKCISSSWWSHSAVLAVIHRLALAGYSCDSCIYGVVFDYGLCNSSVLQAGRSSG